MDHQLDHQPDPGGIRSLRDLAAHFDALRQLAAPERQRQLSVRDIARRTGVAPSTLHPYLRGSRLCPGDVYEKLLRAMGVPQKRFRPWLDAWERVTEAERAAANRPATGPRPLQYTERHEYVLRPATGSVPARISIVTGYIRRVRCAEIWVNPENTNMEMPRFDEYSISAIIRFDGATRDPAGQVTEDVIADELARKVAGRRPVAPASVITTGAGALLESNQVRHVIHVAAVQGQPGSGYRQVADVGRCVTNVLAEAERLAARYAVTTILIPLLGTGVGAADLETTVQALLGAAIDHLTTRPVGGIETVYFLAHTDVELEVCRTLFGTHPLLVAT